MIEVRCFASLAEAGPLRESFDALNKLSRRPDPFSTFAFYENFLAHDEFRSQGFELWLLAAFEDQQLTGYLALKRTSRRALGLPYRKLDFLVTHDTDRPHLVSRASDETRCATAFLRYLVGRASEWDFLEFQQQDPASALSADLGLNPGRYFTRRFPSMENGTIPIQWSSLREYYASLSKKFKTNLSRQMRSLLSAGRVELLSSSDPSVTPILLELLRAVEARSWKAHANATIGRHPQRVEYFRGLLGPHQPMRISITLVLLDGVPIAGILNGAFEDSLYALHIAFDDRLGHLGPGGAVLFLAAAGAIEARCRSYNLLSGSAYYKTRWLAEITETKSAQVFRIGTAPFFKALLGEVKQRVAALRPAAALLFNPARRLAEAEVERSETASNDLATDAERARFVALVAQARKGQVEHLTHEQWLAKMPFDTTPTVAKVPRVDAEPKPRKTGRPSKVATETDVAIIGAGPYGMSIAAHLRARGVPFRIFGPPMRAWLQMSPGMALKSLACATNVSVPETGNTFEDYCRLHGLSSDEPCEIARFAQYGLWVQRRLLPDLTPAEVVKLTGQPGQFELTLAGGEQVRARRVVVAVGLSNFEHLPPELQHLPAALASHTSRHSDFGGFRGQEVAVIGAGQSALQAAALLHEHGALVHMFVRGAGIFFADPPTSKRRLRHRLLYPMSVLGPGRLNWFLEHVPLGVHLLPEAQRVRLTRSHLGPWGAWWLRDRVVGKVAVTPDCAVAAASERNGRVSLVLHRSSGLRHEVVVDHVIAGTGFEVDVDRLPFLSAELRASIARVERAPALNRHFESSVRGLYFVGPASAFSFGPLFRFISGAVFTAPTVANHLAAQAATSVVGPTRLHVVAEPAHSFFTAASRLEVVGPAETIPAPARSNHGVGPEAAAPGP